MRLAQHMVTYVTLLTALITYNRRNNSEHAGCGRSVGPWAATHDHATADTTQGCKHARLSVVLCSSAV